MEVSLERKEFFEDRTLGGFYDEDGKFRWYSLEDKDRKLEEGGIKVPGKTAIARGRYKMVLAWSSKRKGLVPLLLNVPQFIAIQIHIANDPTDVEGCIGVGKAYDPHSHNITQSTIACEECYLWLLAKVIESKNDVWITIR